MRVKVRLYSRQLGGFWLVKSVLVVVADGMVPALMLVSGFGLTR